MTKFVTVLKVSILPIIGLSCRYMCRLDKTQVFHDQIEVKQKELQPWTARINSKQSEIDVAMSERDTLANKVAAVKTQNEEAQEALSKLRAELETKAG